MGRGSSKAGGGSGGAGGSLGGGSLPTPTNFLAPPTAAQVAAGNVMPQGGTPFSDFEKMTDDQKADVIDKALNTAVPAFLDDSALQRFAYFTGMNDKATVVSDAQLDKMSGTEIFRTVDSVYNRKLDIGYSSKEICEQVSSGDFTMYSDSGGSAHGRGIYFATDYTGSVSYGNPSAKPSTMRAKITGGKTITERKLDSDFSSALSKNDKLATACNKSSYADARNLYALAKGYDVIDTKNYGGYHVVLNRRCLTTSSKIKANANGTRSW